MAHETPSSGEADEVDGPAKEAAPRYTRGQKVFLGVAGTIALVAIILASSQWPSALLIRSVFELGGTATMKEMLPYIPDSGVSERLDLAYADAGPNTTFDVFTPDSGTEPLATIVWIHGGAWISGSKEDVAPYLRILASHGYTTVGVNYPLGPETQYPQAFVSLNDALAHLIDNADDLRIDPHRIILAGDSAGAQLASQLAVLTTRSDYAELMGVTPALSRSQLDGIILNCGVYDLPAMGDLNGINAWGMKAALWAYTGTRDWSSTYASLTMSSIRFVDEFPPSFVSGGNGDDLTWTQSVPMANALRDAGTDVTTLFWAAGHEPALGHEYQFHLDLPEAQEALQATLDYLATVDGSDG
ncbi:acetyl esterase/lipase [Homoserinimonas aerilata]|uniref:Acetyl esterase/lipase n=1 Tax=Homoserinimonas aerilata TaxID=1162970 RepID=A0A542YIH6_9MICO|nr:alpha/beta hydrolase [Homoserinimonas aerilata]TQL47878.1 acetyl esterase/lipase [Homoserinimonas aerilata]